jgi:hypothetical protein
MEAILLVLPMESLLCEPEVRSLPTRVTTQKGSNFSSDRCIVLKFLQVFSEAVFLAVTWNHYSVKIRSRRARPA